MKKRLLAMSLCALSTACLLTGCGDDMEADFTGDHGVSLSASEKGEAYKPSDASSEAMDAAADGGAEGYDVEPAVEEGEPADTPVDISEPDEPQNTIGGDPFVLTAGEWNDLENWGFFSNLVKEQLIAFPSFGLDPTCRVAVNLSNGDTPVRNQRVTLTDENGDTVWTAMTDIDGNAYLFYPKSASVQNLKVSAAGAETIDVTAAPDGDAGQGGMPVSQIACTMETSSEATPCNGTQVMFILDTTGSMGDEIMYLQKDFMSIAEEVAGEQIEFSLNLYRDEGDEYVTQCHPFTDHVKDITKILRKVSADGGGDEPEAIDRILTETMAEGVWREDAAKIAFLIFDAPPHFGESVSESIAAAIRSAAAQGIHLVPVVASTANRDTELFGRAAAIMTNSNYVFLTDDSGVGDSHMEPIIGAYEVELLHDIIVRNIMDVVRMTH